MRSLRILLLLCLSVVLATGAEARGAVPADAVPDAPTDFRVGFQTQAGPVVQTVAISGIQSGERVALACAGCLGQTAVQAEVSGTRHVFRPKLRLNAASRLEVTVVGRNFSRTRAYRVSGGRLELDARTCASVAEHRRVRCAALTAPRPWATMNICSSTEVGMRAASPGGGRARDVVAARFRLQYVDGGRWVDVPNGASPRIELGRASRSWQGGYTFRFNAVRGRTFRGVAEFEWRRGTKVVRTAARVTSPRRVSGYSSAVCAV